jgi:hypothetical protein
VFNFELRSLYYRGKACPVAIKKITEWAPEFHRELVQTQQHSNRLIYLTGFERLLSTKFISSSDWLCYVTSWITCYVLHSNFLFLWPCVPTRVIAFSFLRFLDHTQRLITVGRNPLDEWSARRRDLYLTTHSTHNRKTSMPPVGFKPTISAGERSQTYALDRAATETGTFI